MKILYVYDGDWPKGATRVVKETRSMLRAGHDVHLVCRNSDGQPRLEHDSGLVVHRLPFVPQRLVNRALNFPYFFNPVWIWTIWRVGRTLRPDRVVVADLPLALTTIWVGAVLGVPVWFDMAEVYPEFLRSMWQHQPMRLSDHLVRSPRAAEWLERRVLPRVAGVFVVSEESRDRCRSLGVPADRIVIVGNTPADVSALQARHALPPDLAPWRTRPRVLFVGILIADRGVGVAVAAMKRVVRDVPDAVLVVVGDGNARSAIADAVAHAGLSEHVALLGWREHALLPAYYAHAHVGLLPFPDGPHVRITLANKLFDYMAAGLPVVATDLPPMRRIVEGTGAGVLVRPNDAEDLARGIVAVLRDEDRRLAMGRAGRDAVRDRYHWDADAERMLAALTPD